MEAVGRISAEREIYYRGAPVLFNLEMRSEGGHDGQKND
jgi:hypothetical protein